MAFPGNVRLGNRPGGRNAKKWRHCGKAAGGRVGAGFGRRGRRRHCRADAATVTLGGLLIRSRSAAFRLPIGCEHGHEVSGRRWVGTTVKVTKRHGPVVFFVKWAWLSRQGQATTRSRNRQSRIGRVAWLEGWRNQQRLILTNQAWEKLGVKASFKPLALAVPTNKADTTEAYTH